MPNAVAHIIIPMLLVGIFRDYFVKDKKKFPLYYVFIAGIAGALPDIDVLFYYIMSFNGYSYEAIHQTYTHSLIAPLIIFLLAFLFIKVKPFKLKRKKLKISTILFLIAFGVFSHIILDFLLVSVKMFYPYKRAFSSGFSDLIPKGWGDSFIKVFDGIILIIWIVYLELKHKISDVI